MSPPPCAMEEEQSLLAPARPEHSESSSLWSILRLMQPYLWPERLTRRVHVCCTFLMVICSKLCSVFAPLFLASAANRLNAATQAGDGDTDAELHRAILQQMGMYCLLCFLAVVCTELQTLIYMNVKQDANVVLCTQAYKHVLSLSVNWHLSRKTGSTLRVLDRGGKAADELIGFALLNFIPGLFECLAVCFLFIWKFNQLELFVIAGIGVFFYSLITRYVTSQRKQLRKESNSYDNLYSEIASDSFANIEQVKCCNGEKFETQRYSHAVEMYNKSRKFILSATGVLKISQQSIISLTLFCSLYVTVSKVLKGEMNIGDFIAVHSYIIGMFVPLNALGGNYNKIVQALVDVCQLAELMAEVPSVQDSPYALPIPILKKSLQQDTPEGDFNDIEMFTKGVSSGNDMFCEKDISIRFENVGFNYSCGHIDLPRHSDEVSAAACSENSSTVLGAGLDDISFSVPCGTTTAIVGSSGSGKTTLSRLMFRFYDPSRGRIFFNDHDIREYTQESIRSCIGLVPQDTILFNNTILFNIQYGRLPGASIEEVRAACEAAHILDFIEALPNGWDTMVGDRGMKLSGGEKQRVSIARCLLRNPPVIVLDEATSSLDMETEKSVQMSLQSLTQGHRTVVIIAHRLSTVQTADQILVLDKGDIVQRGSHEQLLGCVHGKYKTLWDSQYRDEHNDETLEHDS